MGGGRLQLLVAALLFSTGGAVIKAIDLGAGSVASYRSLVAAAALAALGPRWRAILRPRVGFVAIAYAVMIAGFVGATKYTTAGNAIFLQSTALLWVLVLGPRWLGEARRGGDLPVAALVGIGLLLLLFGGGPAQHTAPDPLLGNAIGLLAGLAWGCTLLGLRWLAGGPEASGTAEAAVVAGNLLAGLACLPLAAPVLGIAPADALAVAALGLFQVALGYVWMTRAVRVLPALDVALILLLEPVLNPLWAWLVHGERLGPVSLLGGALVVAATALRALRDAGGERARRLGPGA